MLRPSTLALLLRRERSDHVAVGLVALLIAFTAFVGSAGLRFLERAADDGLRRAVAEAPVVQRTLRLTTTRLALDDEAGRTLADWRAEGEQMRATFPEPVGRLVGDANIAIDSVQLQVANPPDYPMFIALRYQDTFHQAAEIVAGRWPEATGEQLPPVVEFPEREPGVPSWPVGTYHGSDPVRRFEIALQESTARAVGLSVGYRLSVNADLLDQMLANSRIRQADILLAPTELEITGLYRVRDENSDAWFGEPELRIDDLGNTGTTVDTPIAYITGYVSPDALPGIVSSALPFEYQWRFPILAGRLDADLAEQTKAGLATLESRFAGTDASNGVTAEAGLLPLLEEHRAKRNAATAVVAPAASAPVALAGAALAMAAVLLTHRRRASMIIARGRGASSNTLLAAALSEAAGVATVASAAGLVLAVALLPAADVGPSLVAAVSVAVLAVIVLVAAALPQIRQPLAELERAARPARRPNPRRLVLELTVVAIAAVGAYVLRQRGIASPSGSFDPFLAAVPSLIGIAVGIAAIRLYPPAMAVAGWLADRRRDLVPALGVRTIARGAASGLPALVLVLAVAFAAFTSVVSTSIDEAQQVASWTNVGADARLEGARSRRELPPAFDAASVPRVAAAAVGLIEYGTRAPAGTRAGTLTLVAVDATAYANVVGGSPIEPNWPGSFARQSPDEPVPAVISTRLSGDELGLNRGEEFEILIAGRRVQLEVVDVRSRIGGLTSGDSFVVAPFAAVEQAAGIDLRPTVTWVRVAPDAVPALRDAAGTYAGAIQLTSRYDEYAVLRNEPMLGAVGIGFALAFGVSAVYAVLTILGAVILSAGRRSRDVAILRTLGLRGSQATKLTMIEHVPSILVAIPVGLALGIGVAVAVAPALGLGALSGSSGDVPLAIDWLTLAVLSAALAALALVVVVLGAWLSRRSSIANALRMTSD